MRPGRPARGPEGQDGDAGRRGKPARDGAGQDPGQGSSRLAWGLEGEGGAADGASVGALWEEKIREEEGRRTRERERREREGVGETKGEKKAESSTHDAALCTGQLA